VSRAGYGPEQYCVSCCQLFTGMSAWAIKW